MTFAHEASANFPSPCVLQWILNINKKIFTKIPKRLFFLGTTLSYFASGDFPPAFRLDDLLTLYKNVHHAFVICIFLYASSRGESNFIEKCAPRLYNLLIFICLVTWRKSL